MNNTPSVGPRDFFLWAGAIVALYVSVVSLLALWFEFIDRLWGTDDPYAYADPYSAGIRVAVASLVVIFPLYVYFMRLLHTDIRHEPLRRELWVRRWLLGLTLFIAAFTIVVDLVVLINAFLGGEELTRSFLLKVASVLIVMGGAFLYHLHEVRGTWEREEARSIQIGALVSLVVLASVVSAFAFIGSPATQRALRYDEQRLSDLQSIQWQVTDFWQQKSRLPQTFEELKDPLRGNIIPEDPQAREGVVYEYRATGPASFELCATFARSSAKKPESLEKPRAEYLSPVSPQLEYWEHDAGRTCFTRTIDPERFPPYQK